MVERPPVQKLFTGSRYCVVFSLAAPAMRLRAPSMSLIRVSSKTLLKITQSSIPLAVRALWEGSANE